MRAIQSPRPEQSGERTAIAAPVIRADDNSRYPARRSLADGFDHAGRPSIRQDGTAFYPLLAIAIRPYSASATARVPEYTDALKPPAQYWVQTAPPHSSRRQSFHSPATAGSFAPAVRGWPSQHRALFPAAALPARSHGRCGWPAPYHRFHQPG